MDFLVMVWIGFTYSDLEDPVSEQLMILKTQKEIRYYWSHIVMLLFIGMIGSMIAVAFPVINNTWNHFQLYIRPITMLDIISAVVLHFFASFMGTAPGSLFHSRIIKKRKMAVLLAAVIGIISIVKVSIIQDFPAFGLIGWCIPPIAECVALFTSQEVYQIGDVGKAVGMMGIYGVILTVIKIYLLKRKKF